MGDRTSLLGDTLYGLDVTAAMFDAMGPIASAAPMNNVVNTHANGDHCHGNAQMGQATIIASSNSRSDADRIAVAA